MPGGDWVVTSGFLVDELTVGVEVNSGEYLSVGELAWCPVRGWFSAKKSPPFEHTDEVGLRVVVVEGRPVVPSIWSGYFA